MRPEDDYQLDDLVRDQRRQMWIAGAVVVLAAIYTAVGGSLPGQAPAATPVDPAEPIAPVESATR